MPADRPVPEAAQSLDFYRVLAVDELHPEYQPIVDLSNGDVVGYEALARWPNLPDVTPDVVFAAARFSGRTFELDWACRLAAINDALTFRLGHRHVLFVNVEPEVLGDPPPPEAEASVAAAQTKLRMMIELTERSLTTKPAELIRTVE